jgi:hypothetical protein
MVATRRGVGADAEFDLNMDRDFMEIRGPLSDWAGERGEPQSDAAAQSEGPDATWKFWSDQIKAGLRHEERWRKEAATCEDLWFGHEGQDVSIDPDAPQTPVSDKTALIHANIEVLRPLLFSETPQPIVRRRFRGDGKSDETDLMAAEAGQRLAQYLLDTTCFDDVMAAVRDDWLIAGRGGGRVNYSVEMAPVSLTDPGTGATITVEAKVDERASPRHVEWRRLLLAPAHAWEQMPWLAVETPMTRSAVKARFGEEIAAEISYTQQGLSEGDASRASNPFALPAAQAESGAQSISPFDTCTVWEIWNRDSREVIWWADGYKTGVLDRQPDPLGLEHFYPMPKPLLATTRGQQMTPRPDIAYYENRAREVDEASRKLRSILRVLSISGLYPGEMQDAIKRLLNGNNEMIPVQGWMSLMEKGGAAGAISWLPIDMLVAAAQALAHLREQAKQAMFEASGISDIMRSQGDPSETATAQAIKGRYAGLRLANRQRQMALYARDSLRLMLEIALEHFDTDRLASITALDIPLTEAERQATIMQQQMQMAEYERLAQMHAALAQAVEQGMMPGPVPPAPTPPEMDRVPDTSWELVHDRLRSDFGRSISVSIETQSTILADEQSDKESRIEFITAMAGFVEKVAPLANTGRFDWKTLKELLLFGVRGFPKSRTLEGLLTSLPDEADGQPPEDTAVTVAKIRAEVDQIVESMRMQDRELDREHERQMKGVDLVAEAAQMAGGAEVPRQPPAPAQAPTPPPAPEPQPAAPTFVMVGDQGAGDDRIAGIAAQLQQGLNALAAAQAAPRSVVRDADGRVVGVQVNPPLRQ